MAPLSILVWAVSTIIFAIGSKMIARVTGVSSAISFRGMRFFRDIGRVKARRRLMSGSHNSLLLYSNVLLGHEEILSPNPLEDSELVVDVEELREATGEYGNPLWLSIKGRVYDVSEGASFYGPGARYFGFVARDATRAFCTGCLEPECLIPILDGLGEKQLQEADRWLEFYELHDKYKFVGVLQNTSGAIDDLVAAQIELAEEVEAVGDFTPPAVPP